ncbi:cell wall hydrolase [Erythrobacter sp. SDW2]|uniref:cell wall hydrolase n=1 Tax=Erythrobacter sp. SDW2 TaxID=2907154 RepID=UPI001F39071B|nr:cell wall hydrolase [Erythrobacter sp. SDW2]UIP08108.1 cell wall hydrolase [Erythrobacter sp. SDW2]
MPAPAAPDTPRFAFQRKRRWRDRLGGKRGKALLALFAAITVPAMAAPDQWGAFNLGNGDDAKLTDEVTPMAFEQPGGSFPGSAFYYVEADNELAGGINGALDTTVGAGQYFDPLAVLNGDPAQAVETHDAGPSARAFRGGGSGLDMARALQCLATAVYYEAASESIGGQKAVAQVVLNRVAHPTYPGSICGVVYQGSERKTGCQFSFTCDGSLRRTPSARGWATALKVAREALGGDVYEPVGLATHYHTIWISPYWAPSLDFIGVIGAHRFYRWRGAAGQPSAFRTVYIGGEPLPKPKPQTSLAQPSEADPLDPVALARAYEEARKKAEADSRSTTPVAGRTATAGPAPRYTQDIEDRGGDAQFRAEKLPQSGSVREEYANAGKWKEQP